MIEPIRFCCLTPGCPGECKETKDGVIYCDVCDKEDFSRMKD